VLEHGSIDQLRGELQAAWDRLDTLETELTRRDLQDTLDHDLQEVVVVEETVVKESLREAAANPDQLGGFALMSQQARVERQMEGNEGVFTLFSRIDSDNSGYIDAEELHTAISCNRLLKKRLAEAAGVDAEEALETIERAVITRMDQDWDGKITASEFSKMLSGDLEWGTTITREERTERRLRGAEARVTQRIKETGEFTGLSYEEAMAVGQRAKHYGDAVSAGRWTATYDDTYEGTANNESNPNVFSDGALFAVDAKARQARFERIAEIKKLEHDEYLYKEDFKGLSAEEALAVGEASRHYGDGKSAARWTATYEGTANNESNPDNFSDGAHFAVDGKARQERLTRIAEIRQLEHDQYGYKEDFEGLSAEEALAVGEAAQHYGDAVAFDGEGGKLRGVVKRGPASNQTFGATINMQDREARRLRGAMTRNANKGQGAGLDQAEAARIGVEMAAMQPGEAVEVVDEVTDEIKQKREAMQARMTARFAARQRKKPQA